MFEFLAQGLIDSSSGQNLITLTLIALLSGGVGVALISWLRGRGKDDAERKSIVEEVNETVWQRAQNELIRAQDSLKSERDKREELEVKIEELGKRLRNLEQEHLDAKNIILSDFLESFPDSIIQANTAGIIIRANKSAHDLFGYKEKTLIGLPLTKLMPSRYHAIHRENFEKAIITGHGELLDAERATRVFARHKDGSEFEIVMRLSKYNGTFTNVIRPYYVERKKNSELPLYDPGEFSTVSAHMKGTGLE